jgi:hypothetical protein
MGLGYPPYANLLASDLHDSIKSTSASSTKDLDTSTHI